MPLSVSRRRMLYCKFQSIRSSMSSISVCFFPLCILLMLYVISHHANLFKPLPARPFSAPSRVRMARQSLSLAPGTAFLLPPVPVAPGTYFCTSVIGASLVISQRLRLRCIDRSLGKELRVENRRATKNRTTGNGQDASNLCPQ